MSNRAWVTLATNDSYSLGALVLANSLRRVNSLHPAVVLITPSVTESMRERLRAVFAEVIVVDVMDSKDAAHLALLQRPELGITFTKIHCWNLTQYEKCVFLDADTLVVQNCDELFDRSELSAAPDVGWPDCFNSGVFVFSPSSDTFSKLVTFASERGSFDGGDQGLLNSYFSDWAHGDINKHLPFLYNVTSAAFYSYIPALKHYGQNLKIIHFIGAAKPWLQPYNWQSGSVDAPEHLRDFLQLWWDLFVPQVHSQLDTQMADVEETQLALGQEETTEYYEPVQNFGYYEPALDTSSEFPWHHPENQIQDSEHDVPDIDIRQFHDPWNVYRGNIPPTNNSTDETTEQKEKYEEVRQYAWDYIQPHIHFKRDNTHTYEQYSPHKIYEQPHSQSQDEHSNIWHYAESSHQPQYSQHSSHSHISQQEDHQHTQMQELFYNHDQSQIINHHHHQSNNHQYISEYHHDPHNYDQVHQHLNNFKETQINQMHFDSQNHSNFIESTNKNITKDEMIIFNSMKNLESTYSQFKRQNREKQIYTVMMDHEWIHENHRKSHKNLNGCEFESDNDIYEEMQPRHPYDGFYLRHRMTIDSRGRKVCIHEIPLAPSPTPSLESLTDFEDAIEEFPQDIYYDRSNGDESQTGVAGNLARVVPGAPQQQEAVDELTRRQGWEAGNIDYMGADSFDNIWAKITQTLSQPPSSPPRQPSPPKEQTPVEEAKEVKESPLENVESKPEEPAKGTIPAEVLSESPVAAEAPVVASVSAVSSETPVSTETVVPKEAVETAAPAETVVCVSSSEATACVSIPDATECVSPPEASDTVAPIEAAECVPPSKAPEPVAPIVATDSVAPSDAAETVAPVEVTEIVPLPEAVVSVTPNEAAETVSSPEAVVNVAPAEATETVTSPEAVVNVAPTEATESVSSSETVVNVASTAASESVASPEAVVNVALTETTESVSSPEAVVNVASTEATESVSSPEAVVNVASTEASESVSSPEAVANVASTEATESVSSPEAVVNVASTEASESVSSPEAVANVASTEATEIVSSPEAVVNVASTEATECVSSPETVVNVASTEATESVSSPGAVVNVAPTEASESVSSPEATINVASPSATEGDSSPEATVNVAPSEAAESIAISEIPTPTAQVEEPEAVDIPIPANEATESAGKPEEPIPVPVEAAVAAQAESKEDISVSIDIPVAAVEALKVDDACTPVPQVEPTASESPSSVPASAPAPALESAVEATSKLSSDKPEAVSDTPPLDSTPAKEEIPLTPAAKTEERRKPAGKLTLRPPAPCDALPTPDSELEDAAALAHAIIAGELRTPTVTSPSPPAISSPSAAAPIPPRGLSVDQPEVPTPPVEASASVSLTQIGVKSKPTIASQIETSVKVESTPKSPEAPEEPKTPKTDAPKKKIVRKVVKKVVEKEGASSTDAPVPVPPPRKKEKKPKEK